MNELTNHTREDFDEYLKVKNVEHKLSDLSDLPDQMFDAVKFATNVLLIKEYKITFIALELDENRNKEIQIYFNATKEKEDTENNIHEFFNLEIKENHFLFQRGSETEEGKNKFITSSIDEFYDHVMKLPLAKDVPLD